MTGNDVYKRVINLLGYTSADNRISDTSNLLKRFLEVINQICLDLKVPQLTALSDKLECTELQFSALCYGCAMLLSLIEGDGAKNQIFTGIYNSKRSAALCTCEKVEDKLPRWAE
ncbi:MAG: hypothetical protein E7542_01765 [Ruminococcaceae bacterium]|nr:hypothetical protein [Oscillospiraceae bacterium]